MCNFLPLPMAQEIMLRLVRVTCQQGQRKRAKEGGKPFAYDGLRRRSSNGNRITATAPLTSPASSSRGAQKGSRCERTKRSVTTYTELWRKKKKTVSTK